jgi:hypothetical protein
MELIVSRLAHVMEFSWEMIRLSLHPQHTSGVNSALNPVGVPKVRVRLLRQSTISWYLGMKHLLLHRSVDQATTTTIIIIIITTIIINIIIRLVISNSPIAILTVA